MKATYDGEVDVLRNVLRHGPIVESSEDKPGMILDYDAQNQVVGVEILHLSRRAPELNPGELQFQTA